jgi:hypothetical protein
VPSIREQRVAELEREIQELTGSLQAHSVPPSMLMRLEDLEAELATVTAASPEENPDSE